MADNKPSKDYQKELKDLYDTGTSDRDIEAAKQKQKAQYEMLAKQAGALAGPEEKKPTAMDAIRAIGEGVKKVDRKINDTLDPNGILRKGMVKAAGKEERGILGDYSDLSRDFPELKKKKGGAVKAKKMAKGGSVGSASKRADGCCVKGKTKGRMI